MNDKSKLQAIILSVLSVVGLVVGRLPRIGPVVNLLTILVMDHWDEIWEIIQGDTVLKLKAKGTLALKADKDGLDMAFAMGKGE
jgi:hypothetical protein